VFSLEPGEDFTPDMAHRAIAEGDNEIRISTYLNDDPTGGMSYLLSFDTGTEDKPPEEDPRDEQPPTSRPTRPLTLEEVIRILRDNWPSAE
jgi:hypothetical protein